MPIQTIDQNQLRDVIASNENSDEFSELELYGEGADEDITENSIAGEPEITVTCPPYQRFRYESERPPPKRGPKQRMDMDDDKNTLAEIQLTNFTGRVHLIAYCVTQCGHLHPFRLHGDRCVNGVYQARVTVNSQDTTFKLSKVGVTTPKAKEYEKVVALKKQQLKHLNAAGANKTDMCHDIKDKNTVYLQVEAVLQTSTGDKCVAIDPVIIHNRKAGSEFKVDTVEPACAPATGCHPGNVNKNKVFIVVTEGTAFPNNIGVIIRERKDGQIVWQAELIKDTDIRVIRKAVIEFAPPPYANPKTPESVEVEICLYDIDTGQETEPVAFMYTPVIDEYGISNKAKKRKIDASLTKGYTRSSLTAQGQSTRPTATVHHGHVPCNTNGRQQTQSIPIPSLTSLPVLSAHSTGSENDQPLQQTAGEAISVCQRQQSMPGIHDHWAQLNTNPQIVATPDPNSSLVTSAASVFSSVPAASSSLQTCHTTLSSATASSIQSAQYSWKQSLSGEQAETAQQLQVQDPVQPTLTPTSAVPDNQRQQDLPPPQPQAFGTQQQQVQQQQLEGQKSQLQQQQSKKSQLQLQLQTMAEMKHLLPPNQSFKIICGQVVIVNDDIHTTVAPTQELPSAPVLQNVGGQPVIVQSMQPQQPTSDTSQAEATYPASNQPYSCPASSLQPAAADIQGTTAAPPADLAQIIQQILSQQAMQTDPTAGLQPPLTGVLQAVPPPVFDYNQGQPPVLENTLAPQQTGAAQFTMGPDQMYTILSQQGSNNQPCYSYTNPADAGMGAQFTTAWSDNQQMTIQIVPGQQEPASTGMASSYSQNNLDEDDVEIDSGGVNNSEIKQEHRKRKLKLDASEFYDCKVAFRSATTGAGGCVTDEGGGYFVNDVACNIVVGETENGHEVCGGCEVSFPDNEITTDNETTT